MFAQIMGPKYGGNQHAKACQGVVSSDVRRAAAGGFTDVGPAVKG